MRKYLSIWAVLFLVISPYTVDDSIGKNRRQGHVMSVTIFFQNQRFNKIIWAVGALYSKVTSMAIFNGNKVLSPKYLLTTLFVFIFSASFLLANPPKKKRAHQQKFSTTQDNTKIAQTGDNKRFHTRKKASLTNVHFRANKSVTRSKQRQHARFQGHDDTQN
jgi:hypothetical protein